MVTNRTNRLRIELKLYKDGGSVLKTTRYIKSRVVALVQGRSTPEWDYGVCRVWYSSRNGFFNEFSFTSLAEFKRNLTIDTELSLTRGFIDEG